MSTLTINNLVKTYGALKALDNVNLEVEEGQLIAILGPSGSGKSTLVRAIAGFVTPDSGQILLGDRDITYEKPEKRNTAMVFQSYALWPHMTVYDNIIYALKLRKLPQGEIAKKAAWALKMVDLQGLEGRLPRQLSGGQQQRVALARAMVVSPDILLLDEPLSNLDAKIRYRLRFEIKKLQKRLNITTIYITHDQEEALSIADSVVILKDGQVYQAGAAEEIYSRPRNAFVAEFLGSSNVISLPVQKDDEGIFVMLGGVRLAVSSGEKEVGSQVSLVVRADEISLRNELPDNEDCFLLSGRINDQMYLGSCRRYEVQTIDGYSILADSDRRFENGMEIKMCVDRSKLYIY
jgi:ABC-type Fe3+/spermidine/putrescine transport system ATPase subunit